MSARKSTMTEAKAALVAMAVEAVEIEKALCGPVTDAIAGWLASQYALAARERLATAKGDERMEILHTFAQDWAALRKGDHNAVLIALESQRVAFAEQDCLNKVKRKIIVGLETFLGYVKQHPEAQAAYDELARQLRHPFDPGEQEHGSRGAAAAPGDPTESD